MTLEEIRRGIISLLREGTEVEYITGEDVRQAKGMPFLHVQLIPQNYSTAAAGYHARKEILVDISYMEQLVTDNKNIYAMLEQLDRIFRPFFRIGERAFTCDGRMSITDDIGHYMFTMEFTDTVPYKAPEPAENLQIRWKGEQNGTA